MCAQKITPKQKYLHVLIIKKPCQTLRQNSYFKAKKRYKNIPYNKTHIQVDQLIKSDKRDVKRCV